MKSLMLATTCRRCSRPMKIINPNAPQVISAHAGPPEQVIAKARRVCEFCDCESANTDSDEKHELLA